MGWPGLAETSDIEILILISQNMTLFVYGIVGDVPG